MKNLCQNHIRYNSVQECIKSNIQMPFHINVIMDILLCDTLSIMNFVHVMFISTHKFNSNSNIFKYFILSILQYISNDKLLVLEFFTIVSHRLVA